MGKDVTSDNSKMLQALFMLAVVLPVIKIDLPIPSARLKLGPTVVPNTVTPESMAPRHAIMFITKMKLTIFDILLEARSGIYSLSGTAKTRDGICGRSCSRQSHTA